MQKNAFLLFFLCLSLAAQAQGEKPAPTKPTTTPSTGISKATPRTSKLDLMETTTETIVLKAAYAEFELVPAQYETVTEQVLVKMAHHEGATFRIVTEQVLVKAASKYLEPIQIKWESVEKEYISELPCDKNKAPIKVKYTSLVRAEVLPTNTREIEVPAEYKTIEKYIVEVDGKGPEKPAEYKTIERKVLKTPCGPREIQHPAETKQVTVKKCKLK